jgi:hypothetical protein
MLLGLITAAVDVALLAVLASDDLVVFDRLWVGACVSAHGAVYLLYTNPFEDTAVVLRHFADSVLWAAMFCAPALSSKPLVGLAASTMVAVGLLYVHYKHCLLTTRTWSSMTEFMYLPVLLMQMERYQEL